MKSIEEKADEKYPKSKDIWSQNLLKEGYMEGAKDQQSIATEVIKELGALNDTDGDQTFAINLIKQKFQI